MGIKWRPLFEVFVVSLGSTVVVVALVTVALVGLSGRAAPATATGVVTRRPALAAGTVTAAVCLAAAAAIVLFGLWVLVAM